VAANVILGFLPGLAFFPAGERYWSGAFSSLLSSRASSPGVRLASANGRSRAKARTARAQRDDCPRCVHEQFLLHFVQFSFHHLTSTSSALLLYFVLVLGAFILALFELHFFESRRTSRPPHPLPLVVDISAFLIPYLVSGSTPLGASRGHARHSASLSNEQRNVAFQGSGISLYRLALRCFSPACSWPPHFLVLRTTLSPQRQPAPGTRFATRSKASRHQTSPARSADFPVKFPRSQLRHLHSPPRTSFGGLSVDRTRSRTFVR